MTENIEKKADKKTTPKMPMGMNLRKRIKEGKKQVYRMVYVEHPQQSSDELHNKKREAKHIAAQRAKEQKSDIQKEIKKQMDIFDARFILACMNRFAPKGWRFVTTGGDNRIAMQSVEIMGNQAPRGAFVSDISFDLIFGLYGDLLAGKVVGPDENLYERMKFFDYAKPFGVSKEQHEKYTDTIKDINAWDFGLLPPLSFKSAAMRPFAHKNSILVQGVMDSGEVPPQYLNERMHKIVNETVWWTFRRVMSELKLSRLEKLRKTYRSHLVSLSVIPGRKFALATQPEQANKLSPEQKALEKHLDDLITRELPQAKIQTREDFISLHRQMAELADLQTSNITNGRVFEPTQGIKPSKRLRHQIQNEIDGLCSGQTQKQRVKDIQQEIKKTINALNEKPKEIVQPARDLMPNVFFIDGNRDQMRKINNRTNTIKQMTWLAFGRVQKTK